MHGRSERGLELTAGARIRRARETLAILDLLVREPTAENVVALHELHARHLREQGDDDGAGRADERAAHARSRAEDYERLRISRPSASHLRARMMFGPSGASRTVSS